MAQAYIDGTYVEVKPVPGAPSELPAEAVPRDGNRRQVAKFSVIGGCQSGSRTKRKGGRWKKFRLN